ncbi:MAG: hypothetical protein M1828_004786 [Chrysothrix sp. TS-e1954]|nr:MAG: hypothetical protein M1828_004786 [Chrysothrix sp. TS-e1954]
MSRSFRRTPTLAHRYILPKPHSRFKSNEHYVNFCRPDPRSRDPPSLVTHATWKHNCWLYRLDHLQDLIVEGALELHRHVTPQQRSAWTSGLADAVMPDTEKRLRTTRWVLGQQRRRRRTDEGSTVQWEPMEKWEGRERTPEDLRRNGFYLPDRGHERRL